MARKRMISPNIWGDPSFNQMSHSARLLVIGMISNSDDYGRERGDIGSLRRSVFGFDEVLPDGVHMSYLIKEIKEKMGRTLHFYESDGQTYYHFVNWNKYQKQQKDRMQASDYPPCSVCKAGAKHSLPEVVEVDKEKRTEEVLRFFETFWIQYPKKTAKKAALKIWLRINPNAELFQKIMTGLTNARRSKSWVKDNGQYIPYPATWLNQERWNDVVEAVGAGSVFEEKKICVECKRSDLSSFVHTSRGITCMDCR